VESFPTDIALSFPFQQQTKQMQYVFIPG